MNTPDYTRGDHSEHPSAKEWSLKRLGLAIGGVALAALALKGCNSLLSTTDNDEVVAAKMICLADEARGRWRPTVESVTGDGKDTPSRVLNLEDSKEICYPTLNGTVKVSPDVHNGANGDWINVEFKDIHEAIKNDQAVDAITGERISTEDTRRLGEFASNWPIDFVNGQYTWVNFVKADIVKA